MAPCLELTGPRAQGGGLSPCAILAVTPFCDFARRSHGENWVKGPQLWPQHCSQAHVTLMTPEAPRGHRVALRGSRVAIRVPFDPESHVQEPL